MRAKKLLYCVSAFCFAGSSNNNVQPIFPGDNEMTTNLNKPPSQAQSECERIRHKMQSMFNVPVLSSAELQEQIMMEQQQTNKAPRIVLVDVRTKAEQDVSILQGAVPLSAVHKVLTTAADTNVHVVTYCSVGFRASLEAQRLQTKYPSLRVSSLDGIACYTDIDWHHYAKYNNENDDSLKSSPSSIPPRIVNPQTGQPTQRVHTFAKKWNKCVHPDYESVNFSPDTLSHYYSLEYGVGVVLRVVKDKVEKLFLQL